MKKEDGLEEFQRRQTVAQMKKAGTDIRKEELERIRMSSKILLERTKSIYESIKDRDSTLKRGLEHIIRIDEAETEEEQNLRILRGMVDFLEDTSVTSMVQPEVDGLVEATNDIITQLEKNGVHFSFPRFTSYQGITACKFTLEGIIGFLRGVAEA
jgi:hypothetical protein